MPPRLFADRLFAVVVLYRQTPAASRTLATLAAALERTPGTACMGLVFDNSPAGGTAPAEAVTKMLPGFHYHAAMENGGLLDAYREALRMARAERCDWLLTLDQDTELPEDFLSALAPGLTAAARDPRIAAIVPHLAEGRRALSPAYPRIGRPKPLPPAFSGVPTRETHAFNSAALLRVAALDAIGGFDPCFRLDHLDSWLHHRLYAAGWRTCVLGNLSLQHQLSLFDYGERMPVERYRNFLAAESAFVDLARNPLARLAYTVQLAVRLVNQRRRGEAPAIRHATRAALFARMTLLRRTRLARWRAAAGCADARRGHTP